ncbi:hypothetical protein EXT01_02070, partial [Helicobacter pylori]
MGARGVYGEDLWRHRRKLWQHQKTDERVIYLAGGCFWGLEAYMERIYGV